jgi:hypothetical protein
VTKPNPLDIEPGDLIRFTGQAPASLPFPGLAVNGPVVTFAPRCTASPRRRRRRDRHGCPRLVARTNLIWCKFPV